ncbi:MAG: CBS domain-containing protein [Candidatus Nanohaloarchaea archaeon]
MTSVEKVAALEVMEEDPVTVQRHRNLGSVKNLMEEEELRAITVVDSEDRLEGAVSYRELIRHIKFNPGESNIGKVMHQPPKFDQKDSLVELCDLRINSGRKLLVALDSGKLAGVIGDEQFRQAFSGIEELQDVTTGNLASRNVETVEESESLEKARHSMLDNNISRLPVVDSSENLTGIVRSTDLLRMIVPMESQDAGGTSGGRKNARDINIAGGSEKQKMSDIPVRELMKKNVDSSEHHIEASSAAEKFESQGLKEMIFTDQGHPDSILSLKDFVDYLAEFAPGRTIMVNLIGLEMPEEKAAVHDKISNQLRGSLGRKLERPEELTVRFKKAEKDGKKHRWEIEMKLYSEYGMLNVEEEAWDMLEAVDEALGELDSIVRKRKERRKEH